MKFIDAEDDGSAENSPTTALMLQYGKKNNKRTSSDEHLLNSNSTICAAAFQKYSNPFNIAARFQLLRVGYKLQVF